MDIIANTTLATGYTQTPMARALSTTVSGGVLGDQLVIVGRNTTTQGLATTTNKGGRVSITPVIDLNQETLASGRLTITTATAGQNPEAVIMGTPITIRGTIASGLSKPGYDYKPQEAASSADMRNGYYGQHTLYERGGKLQFTLNDIPEATILSRWPTLLQEIATHPFVLIHNYRPLYAAYCWCNAVPVPVTTKPGLFQITWDLITY